LAASSEQWRGFPIDLPNTAQVAQQEEFIALETSATLEAVVTFYQQRLQPSWTLFEQLWAEQTRFAGRAVFLLFGKAPQAVCILATTANDPAAGDKNLVTLSTDCAALRLTADHLRTVAWNPPGEGIWKQWSGDRIALRYPAGWREDQRLSQMNYCRPGSGIHCLLALARRDQDVEGILTLTSKSRPAGQSLSDVAVKAWQDGAQATPGLIWVVGQRIQLDDGAEAVQIISTVPVDSGMGIISTMTVASNEEVYMLTGSAVGESEAVLTMSELLCAMMRSFHLTDQ